MSQHQETKLVKPCGEPRRTTSTKHSSQGVITLFPVNFSPFPLLVSVTLVNLKKRSPLELQ